MLSVPVYEIRYDAREGFAASRASVCFLDEHSLLELNADDVMCFRVEGSAWEPKESSEEGEEASADDEESHPVLGAINQVFARRQAERAASLEDDSESTWATPMSAEESTQESEKFVNALLDDLATKHESTLRGLPAGQQYTLIDTLKRLKKGLVAGVAEVLQTKGTITQADAWDIVDKMKRNSAQ